MVLGKFNMERQYFFHKFKVIGNYIFQTKRENPQWNR
jgi:hypothetical protein